MTYPRIIFPRVPHSWIAYRKYEAFIHLRLGRPKKKGKGVHLHHIIPRCLKGKDEKDNLVSLTYSEHFYAHYLLTLVFPKHRGLLDALKLFDAKSSWEYQEAMENYSSTEVSEDVRNKLRESTTRLWENPSYREKVTEGNKGPKHDDDSKRKIRESKIRQWKDPEYREKMSDVLDILAIPPSDETKRKMSESHTGKKLSPEHVEAAAEGRKDKKVWSQFDYIFQVWVENGCCNPSKLWRITKIGKSRNSLKTMVEEFRKMI